MEGDQFVAPGQVDALAQAIASAQLEHMGPGIDKFCKLWPSIEEGLTSLQAILAVVPGVSAFAGPAIGVVRAAGGAAARATCAK